MPGGEESRAVRISAVTQPVFRCCVSLNAVQQLTGLCSFHQAEEMHKSKPELSRCLLQTPPVPFVTSNASSILQPVTKLLGYQSCDVGL